jgi:TonB family protein
MVLAVAATLVPASLVAQDGRKVKKEVKPDYPALAKEAHVSGLVRLQVVIAPSGHVKSASVVGGHPLLIASAMQAVKEWQYEPATEETTQVVVFNFNN